MDIGTTLREARERRGMALGEVARATNIPWRVLDAIDSGDLARVPGGLFARAHLRAYALQVGLNPDAIVAAHLAATVAAPDQDLHALRVRCAGRGPQRGAWRLWLAAAVVALIACTAWFSQSGEIRDEKAGVTSSDAHG